MVGFPSSSGGGGGAAAAVGWTQIAHATPNGVAQVDFTSIPQTYSDLLVVFEGVSHNSGSNQSFQVAVNDGASFTSNVIIGPSVAASAVMYGSWFIPGYTFSGGISLGMWNNHAASPALSSGGGSNLYPWRADGGIEALRLAVSAGNFDAGTITLYGR